MNKDHFEGCPEPDCPKCQENTFKRQQNQKAEEKARALLERHLFRTTADGPIFDQGVVADVASALAARDAELARVDAAGYSASADAERERERAEAAEAKLALAIQERDEITERRGETIAMCSQLQEELALARLEGARLREAMTLALGKAVYVLTQIQMPGGGFYPYQEEALAEVRHARKALTPAPGPDVLGVIRELAEVALQATQHLDKGCDGNSICQGLSTRIIYRVATLRTYGLLP